jgi:hypothetical protein
LDPIKFSRGRSPVRVARTAVGADAQVIFRIIILGGCVVAVQALVRTDADVLLGVAAKAEPRMITELAALE